MATNEPDTMRISKKYALLDEGGMGWVARTEPQFPNPDDSVARRLLWDNWMPRYLSVLDHVVVGCEYSAWKREQNGLIFFNGKIDFNN